MYSMVDIGVVQALKSSKLSMVAKEKGSGLTIITKGAMPIVWLLVWSLGMSLFKSQWNVFHFKLISFLAIQLSLPTLIRIYFYTK